ncbi:MAG TPA: sigma-70 family RNA polymerase sigma factor [Pirellulales bacterium]|nr:sigma-70 family RNA polymerase sigma factor [Pirellulales bacterium]
MLQPAPSREDLRAARAGDRAAMDRLLSELRPWLEGVSARYYRHDPDGSCSDLVQEASLTAWLKLAQFRGHEDGEQEIKMFRGWLEQIMHRLAQNQARRAHTQRRHAGPFLALDAGRSSSSAEAVQPRATGPTASSAAAGAEAACDVRAAIADLSDATDRLIIHECFFAGRSLRDLADDLGIDRETLRRRFHALLDGLREKLLGHR